MRYEIITIGSAVIDAFLDTGMPEKHGDICFPMGQKLTMKNLWYATGGGGTNTAAAFAELGMKTGYLGVLGKDINASIILKELIERKIKFLGYQIDEPTGFSVIVDSAKHERTILTYRGANDFLDYEKIKIRKLKAQWFYMSSMTENSLHAEEKLAQFARKKGIKIAYNPSSFLTKKGPKYLSKILKNVEVIILNREEAQQLTRSQDDLFRKLHNLGPKIVCITNGSKGNSVSDKRQIITSLPSKIKVKERTGAGDAFASGFVVGMIKFNDIEKAILCGSLNAESVIQKPGAKNGLLTWHEMLHQLSHKNIKLIQAKN